jgi:hypothetical protein
LGVRSVDATTLPSRQGLSIFRIMNRPAGAKIVLELNRWSGGSLPGPHAWVVAPANRCGLRQMVNCASSHAAKARMDDERMSGSMTPWPADWLLRQWTRRRLDRPGSEGRGIVDHRVVPGPLAIPCSGHADRRRRRAMDSPDDRRMKTDRGRPDRRRLVCLAA